MLSIRSKFNSKEFSLKVDEPETFVICQWQRNTSPSIWYIIYRWILAIFFFTTWLASILIVKDTDPPYYQAKYPIYLTNWGYTLCTLQALLAAIMISGSMLSYRSRRNDPYENSAMKIYKIYWFINVVATAVGIIITIIYWTCIYQPKKGSDAINFIVHGMNSILLLLDFWMVSHPVRLAHFIYPLIFSSFYVTFSVIYYLVGGTSREGTTYIYPILDWGDPVKSLLVVLVVAFIAIFIHVVLYFMYLARQGIYKKFCKERMADVTISMFETNNQRGLSNEAVIVDEV